MDWIAYLFLICQMVLLSYKPSTISHIFNIEKLAFLCGLIGCMSLIIFGTTINSVPMVLVNTIIGFLNLRGYIK